MKAIALIPVLLFSMAALAQKPTQLSHGKVYGKKPNTTGIMDASKIEAFMGKETRTSTTIRGRVVKVTKQQGGWFTIDAGNGKTIAAHFKVYNVSIPMSLTGHTVIAEGIAQKQFIADDSQHLAGSDKQRGVKANPKQNLTFEVTGLLVE